MAADSSTVPPDDALIRSTNEAFADDPAPLYLTPTLTTFIVEPDVSAAGVASRL